MKNINKRKKALAGSEEISIEAKKEEVFTSKQPLTEKQVTDLVKVETFKQISSLSSGLSDLDKKIAEDYANGDLEEDIIRNNHITKQYYAELFGNPAFMVEAKRLVHTTGFSDKDNLLRLNSRMGMELYQSILRDIGDLTEVSLDKRLKALKEIMEVGQKLLDGNKVQVKVDIVQMINNHIKDQHRVKIQPTGEVEIVSEYPQYDEETDTVIGDYSFIESDTKSK